MRPISSMELLEPTAEKEQKSINYALSWIRVLVENAISGIKWFNLLVHVFRNRKAAMNDDFMVFGAGLCNFLLA